MSRVRSSCRRFLSLRFGLVLALLAGPVRAVPVQAGTAAEGAARGWPLFLLLLLLLLWSWRGGLAILAGSVRRLYRHLRPGFRLEELPMGLLLVSPGGRVEDCNGKAAELLGCDPVAVGSFSALFGPVEDDLLAALADGSPHRVRPALQGDGRCLLLQAGLRNGAAGSGLLVAVMDDSERAARELELERRELAFLHAPWGIVVGTECGGMIRDANLAFAAMHGYRREEMLGMPVGETYAPSVRAGLAGHIETALREGRHAFDSMRQRRNGTEFPARVDVNTVSAADGRVRYRIVNVQDVSRQRSLEQALQENERMLRLVLDHQQDMVVRCTPETVVAFANRAYAEAVGTAPDDLVGRPWGEALRRRGDAEEEVDEFAALLAELAREPRRLELVRPMAGVDGVRRWVQWSILPLFLEGRVLEGFQVSGHDITARRMAEQAATESESRFRTLFDSPFHLAAVVDGDGILLAINANGAAFVGRERQALRGLSLWELPGIFPEESVREVLRRAVVRAAENRAVRIELAAVAAAGGVRVLDLSLRRTAADGAVLVEALDITPYREQERRIQERDARLQAIAESMPGIAFEFRREDHGVAVVYVNKAVEFLCGVAPSDFESGAYSLLDCLHAADRDAFLAALTACESQRRELRWTGRLARDGASWLSLRALPREVDGRVHWSGVGLDITEMKEKELEIERSRRTLRELSAHYETVREDERRHMAREVHDELGQNLTALRMGLAVMGARPRADGIADEAQRLKALVDKAIGVVRSIATTLRPAAMDLGIAAALHWLAGEFETNTRVGCVVDADLGGLSLDDEMATTLFRIAQESLTNVARHGEASHVWIRLCRVNRHLVLEVGDDGRGFDPRRTADHGFGLLGMKERALSLGGEMTVNSQPGEGTVISIHILLGEPD